MKKKPSHMQISKVLCLSMIPTIIGTICTFCIDMSTEYEILVVSGGILVSCFVFSILFLRFLKGNAKSHIKPITRKYIENEED